MSVRDDRPATGMVRRALAGGALGLAVLAAVLPAPDDAGIAPLELAERIRARDADLRILDVSGVTDMTVPRAVNVDPEAPEAWPLEGGGDVVVYGIDDAASRAGRDAARTHGRPDARHLRGGLGGWVSDVLEPVLPVPANAADSAAVAHAAQLSRYFGGTPRSAAVDEVDGDAAERVRRAVRRGCGPGR